MHLVTCRVTTDVWGAWEAVWGLTQSHVSLPSAASLDSKGTSVGELSPS